MPPLATWVVYLHVLAVFWLVSGSLGRGVTFSHANRATDLPTLRAFATLASAFELAMVRPGSLLVLVSGLIAAWLRGWPILGPLQGSPIRWVFTSLVVYLTIIPVIVFVFLPRAKVYHARLAEASAEGRITPALKAALNDPAVKWGRRYEILMIVALTWLMVTKPF